MLVHGLGGSGKSRLLRHFREMADGSAPDAPVPRGRLRTVWLDWKDEQRDDPSRYANVEGPSLVTVLDAVQRAVVDAFGEDAGARQRAGDAFASYRQGAARMPDYAARFANVLTQGRHEAFSFTPEDASALARSAVSAGLTVGGHPGGVLGLTPDQLAASAKAGGRLSSAALRAVTGKKDDEITLQEYDLVTDPERELTRRTGTAVQEVAREMPLVVLLDTGEVINPRAWRWLRWVMTLTANRVVWVVGARFETETEAGVDSPVAEFVRDIGDEHLVLMSPTRFDDSMVREYLENQTRRAYSDDDVDRVARFTKGLPLAVSLTATLLDEGQSIDNVCRETDDGQPSSVVSGLARSYLIHAEQHDYAADDPRRNDVDRILGLALAYGDLRSDPELLAALWEVPEPLAATAFGDLAQRHDFVLPVARRLHDDVRDALRVDLLDPYRRARVREVNQRALDLFTSRVVQMRDKWPSLDEQLDHDEYTTALLAGLWHTFWLDNQAGLDLFAEILPVLAVTARNTANAATAIVNDFVGTFNDDQQRHFAGLLNELLAASLPHKRPARRNTLSDPTVSKNNPLSESTWVDPTLPVLALHRDGLLTTDLSGGNPADRRVSLLILEARLQTTDGDSEEAIANLRTAAAETTSSRLRRSIGAEAKVIADQLIWTGHSNTSVPTAVGLAAAKLATEALSDDEAAWFLYAAALNDLDRHQEALAAYDRVLELNPDHAVAHSNRGVTLNNLGKLREALAAHDRALALDPDFLGAHSNRGLVLGRLGEPDEALAAHDRALKLNPDHAGAHRNRGDTLRHLGRLKEALAFYNKALEHDPDNANDHALRGLTLGRLGQLEEALAAFDRAIELKLDRVGTHVNRGVTLTHLGRFQEALAAYDRSLVLDPDHAGTHVNKGIALAGMGDLDSALIELDTAERLAPDGAGEARAWAGAILRHCGDASAARARFEQVEGRVTGRTPFRTAEMEAVALCGLGRADDAEQRLLGALPHRIPADSTEPRKIYELLADPPLPGIDRLRRIVDSGT